MQAYVLLFFELLFSIFASLIVLRYLSTPLLLTLTHICPDTQSAGFWLIYTRVMLVIAPLALVLLMEIFARAIDPLDSLRLTLLAVLLGLTLGMYLIGRRLAPFTHPASTGGSTQ